MLDHCPKIGTEIALPDESSTVWNPDIDARNYGTVKTAYQTAILEQYKLCVEMADRTSQRRSLANTFFLTLNSAFVTIIASLFPTQSISAGWLSLPLTALLLQCLTWYFVIRSYRMLNSTKYKIINAIEGRLPANPWKTEWRILGAQTGRGRYWRFTLLERWVPVVFAVIYVSGYCSYVLR